MAGNSDRHIKTTALSLLSIGVVLFAFLVAFAAVVDIIPDFFRTQDEKIVRNKILSEDDFDNGISACAVYLSGNNSFGGTSVTKCFTYFSKSSSVPTANENLDKHLKTLWGGENPPYTISEGDFDNDGINEFLFVLSDCAGWASKVNNADALSTVGNIEAISGADKTIFVYCDIYRSTAVYQFFVTSGCSGNVTLCLWDSNRLIIETDAGKATFFVCDAKNSIQYDYSTLFDKLEEYLDRMGYGYIYHTDARLCESNKKQGVFVYGYDGDNYNAAVCVFYGGRVIPVFKIVPEENKALFLLDNGSNNYLLTYRNWQSGGNSCYEYQKFGFNSDYSINIVDSQAVLENDAADANKVTGFFDKFRALIDESSVCADPYQLTGYTTNFSYSKSETTKSRYLKIDNCSTAKSGIVDIEPKPDNWLNLRVGPAVTYDKVTVSDGFVKQACGSVVTVIDTVNTGDTENPIWVKTQINYGGETVTGFSSQRYVRLENIRHIDVGEQFTITADTNDSGLVWQVNDSAVASIDVSSGRITGLKQGLVLVTVSSASGLKDTCLVAID